MATLDRPKLRPMHARRVDHQGQAFVALDDPLGIAASPMMIPMDGFHWVVRHFDGKKALSEIQADVLRQTGQLISSADLESLVNQLDRAMVLDGPTFATFHETYRNEHTRLAAFAGRSYAGTERALRSQLARFFAHEGGAGAPAEPPPSPDGRLRGILSPHIDFGRGGPVYTWSYKELRDRCDAEVFVILGVAHQYCRNRFALTRKDFATPLGLARTDRSYVARIAALAGEHVFDDELAHRTEHSIEFQVVFLQYLLGPSRDFSIVPILVGSFHDLMESGTEPIDDPEVRRFVEALKAAERAGGKKVAYIGGIDLAHVGREFGDPNLLDTATLDQVHAFDAAMIDRAAAADPAGWFRTAAEVQNRWRVCGLAATYTMLHAMGPATGTLLRYDQAVNPERTCCVSFCSVSYETQPTTDGQPAIAP
ncbi:MAG: putative dioxygenase [Planctomycetota bacterium]|nr:putative dioxygenase [Planctomycetota bacterium]